MKRQQAAQEKLVWKHVAWPSVCQQPVDCNWQQGSAAPSPRWLCQHKPRRRFELGQNKCTEGGHRNCTGGRMGWGGGPHQHRVAGAEWQLAIALPTCIREDRQRAAGTYGMKAALSSSARKAGCMELGTHGAGLGGWGTCQVATRSSAAPAALCLPPYIDSPAQWRAQPRAQHGWSTAKCCRAEPSAGGSSPLRSPPQNEASVQLREVRSCNALAAKCGLRP